MSHGTQPARADYDKSFSQSEESFEKIESEKTLHSLILENKTLIQELLVCLDGAKPYSTDSLHVVQMLAWDDRVNDFRELLTKILKEV